MDKLQIKTDIHSHLLPGLDDGARNMEQTLLMLEGMQQAGFEHLYFSPHVSASRYPNTKSAIESRFREVKDACREKGIALELGLCAEYYIDREFMEMAESGEPLLTLPGNHILVETSMMQEPLYLSDALFSLQNKGYTPILAHPERYPYYEENSDILLKLHHSGCLFQANLFSFCGHYGKSARKKAESLLKGGLIDFIGTDLHHPAQLALLTDRSVRKAAGKMNVKNDMFNEPMKTQHHENN